MNSVSNSKYEFNLDRNPLTNNQQDFLKSKDGQGYNKAQFRDIFRDRLDESLRHIFWILEYTHNLRKSDIYEIFNAKSFEFVIRSLLRNTDENIPNMNEYQYDFRTSELARLLFFISIDYLHKSTLFKNENELFDNLVRPLAKNFNLLSESTLQHEDKFKTINTEEYENLMQELDRMTKMEPLYDSFGTKKYYENIEKQIEENYRELYKLDLADRIKSGEIPLKLKEPIQTPGHGREEILEFIIELEDLLETKFTNNVIRESIEKRLSHTYDHLEPFACRINPLTDFNFMLQRIAFDNKYIKDVGKDLREDQEIQEFEQKLVEKYRGKPIDKSVPHVIILDLDGKSAVAIPKKEYEKEHKKFQKSNNT